MLWLSRRSALSLLSAGVVAVLLLAATALRPSGVGGQGVPAITVSFGGVAGVVVPDGAYHVTGAIVVGRFVPDEYYTQARAVGVTVTSQGSASPACGGADYTFATDFDPDQPVILASTDTFLANLLLRIDGAGVPIEEGCRVGGAVVTVQFSVLETGDETPTPTPTPTPSATPTATPTPDEPFVPTPTPSPAPTGTPSPGVVRVDRENEVTVSIPLGEPVRVVATSSAGGAQVSAPAGALPAGARLSVASIGNIEQVLAQAPLPASADVMVAFVMEVMREDGAAATETFAAPVVLEFVVDASVLPAGTRPERVVLAFWNGSHWAEVEAQASSNADGSMTVTATVSHFTMFSVFVAPDGWGTFTREPGRGLTLTRWQGGHVGRLATAVGPGGTVWVSQDGRLVGYRVGAPAFANAPFASLFPDGMPEGTPVIVRR